MNTFGRFFRISILGESHGESVGILIDGCPAGLSLSPDDFVADLARRKSGIPGTTARREADLPLIKSGLFNGKSTGAPILVLFRNLDVGSGAYEEIKRMPRPGHADLTAYQKSVGFNDYRGGGHFSGRLTVALTAAGVAAKKLIYPVSVVAALTEAGGSVDVGSAVQKALEWNDSIGGIVECRVRGIAPGLGEPFFDSVESLISHAVFSIPGIKGIEFGAGFFAARMTGSECNDEILDLSGKTGTNNAGGINGGITNGNDVVFRVAVKPTSTVSRPQKTIDLVTGEARELTARGRHDACIALRVPVIVEAVTACVLADLMCMDQKIPRVGSL
jgi:chorismate synthase